MVFVNQQRLILAATQHNLDKLFTTSPRPAPAALAPPLPCPKPSAPMSTSHPAETLLIEGTDAAAFAHAQFGSKVSSLAIGQWQFSAWLDPKGRVQAFFHLARLAEQRYLLLLRGGSASSFGAALQRFVLRSKVSITVLPAQALASGPAMPMHAAVETGNTIALGCDSYSFCIQPTGGDDAWRLPQLRKGWAWLPSQLVGELLPAALSLQRLHAVSVDKGCYPGQEIVARLHFRGGHKRHLHSVILSQAAAAGDTLHHEGHEVGYVIDAMAASETVEALVILSDSLVAAADTDQITLSDDQPTIRIVESWTA